MPYITYKRKKELGKDSDTADNAGELNYNLTRLVIAYVDAKGLSYQTINDVKGALQGCLAEFDRRVTNPYEDEKMIMNGDVYKLLNKRSTT